MGVKPGLNYVLQSAILIAGSSADRANRNPTHEEAAAMIQIIDWTTITNFVTDVFIRYGVPAADAAICADVLLESDRIFYDRSLLVEHYGAIPRD